MKTNLSIERKHVIHMTPIGGKKIFPVVLKYFLIILLLFPSIFSFAQVSTFYSSGTWTCPAGVTSISVECWGAGGAGGSVNASGNQAGSGGGGGGYTLKTYTVVPGTVYNVTVGTGGIGDANNTTRAQDGGNSYFNNDMATVARGGTGGGSNGANHGSGQAGAPQTKNGGNGTDGNSATPLAGAGGSGAGSTTNGSNASGATGGAAVCGGGGPGADGVTGNSAGNNGGFIGGGGSGATKTGPGSYAGGNGANGLVVITVGALSTIKITALSANICVGGSITITGSKFGTSLPSVFINGIPATSITSYADKEIIAVIGTPCSGIVTVVTPTGTANSCLEFTAYPLASATISGTSSVCKNSTAPNITFTGSGIAPFTFTYKINGGANQTVSTTSGNSVTVSQSTATAGTYTYSLVSVSDAGSCGTQAATGIATVTVDPLTVGGSVSTSASVCSGSNSGTLTLSGHAGNVVRWESSTDGGSTWTTIVNTTTSQGYTNLAATTLYRAVVQSGSCSTANSTSATLTVNPVSVGGSVSSNATVCSGLNSGTLTLSGHTGSVTRWESSSDGGTTWSTIVNTTTSLVYTNITQTTQYRAVVQSSSCASANSTPATITVNPVSIGGTAGTSTGVCTGTNSGTITLSGQTGNVIRWESSTNGGTTWSTIVNTTTSQNYTNLATTTLYRAVVQSGVCATANSSAATITVNPVSVGGSVSSNATVCSGSNSGTLTLSGHTGSATRWESSTDGGTTWSTIVNTTTSLVYTNITQTTQYRAVIQSGACASANSTSATITVNPVSIGGTAGTSTSVCTGTNSGTITLSGQTGNVIRWESSTNGGTTWSTIVNTTTSQSYTNIAATTLYRAVVQSGVCTAANSSAATITVNPVSVGGSVSSNATVCSGSNSGTLTLSGHTGSVTRWESSINGGTTWSTIVNTTTSLSYTNLTQTTQYRAVVQSGACASANSTAANITVNPISIGGSVSINAAVCSGANSGTLNLSGQTGTVIRWESSTNGGSTWSTIVNVTASQSYLNLTQTTLYRAVVQSGICAAANSIAATITVDPLSVGGTVGSSTSVCLGSNSGTLTLSGHTGNVIRWESSTDGGTSWTNIVNTTGSLAYNNLVQTTQFRAVVKSGSCSIANSGTATITVNAAPAASISYAGSPFCNNTGITNVTLSGTGGGIFSASPSGANVNVSTGALNLSSSSPGLYTINYTLAASGGCPVYTISANISIRPSTWIGAINTDWDNPGNWAGNAIPNGECTDVTILSGVPNQPVINSGKVEVPNLIINSGAYITVTGTLKISGVLTNSGSLNVSNGTVEVNGNVAQTIPANAFQNNLVDNLVINNSSTGGVSLGGPLVIKSSLTYAGTGMKFLTNDYLTLKSSSGGTAWVGDMTGNTITGKVTVEQYQSARKGWRLLSIPTNSTQTIRETYQEGCGNNSNCVSGFGTQITGPGGIAAGFDLYSALPSMKTYDPATASWVGVSGTNATGIRATDGYMVFFRGDRSVTTYNAAPTSSVLRTKGTLYVGDQSPISIPASKFSVVGNPYANDLDMRNIYKTGLKEFFYLWDPQLAGTNGYGAFQTFSNDGGGNYVITPGGGSFNAGGSISNFIPSGQAFMVEAMASGGAIIFKENAKSNGSILSSRVTPVQLSQLRLNLYGVYSDSSTYLADGLLVNYGDNGSNLVDDKDALKSPNTSENLSVKTDNKLLVIERRHTITGQDTIYLNLTNVKVQNYRFEIIGKKLLRAGLTGFILDNYTNTTTQLNIDGATLLNFNIVNIPGSYAPNRFKIIFRQVEKTPGRVTTVKANTQNDKKIHIAWQAETENNMKEYELQRASDSNQFKTIALYPASANPTGSASGQAVDENPIAGDNYYRIKSVDMNGRATYSEVVKVMNKGNRAISIYPNPITGCNINLQLTNQPEGVYLVRVYNKSGQTVLVKQIQHFEGTSTEILQLKNDLPQGIYNVEIRTPDNQSKVIMILK